MLLHAAKALQSSRQIVLKAVQQNGCALQYASEALQADFDVVLTAVRSQGSALLFASPELQKSETILRFADAVESA